MQLWRCNMIPAKKSRTSISGEATDFDDCDQIPMSQMAELYVAIKHIVQEGKEALMCMNMRQTDDKIIVNTQHWRIFYREEAQKLNFVSLQYKKR